MIDTNKQLLHVIYKRIVDVLYFRLGLQKLGMRNIFWSPIKNKISNIYPISISSKWMLQANTNVITNNTTPESLSFKLFSLTFTSNMNWKKYIKDIAKAAAKTVDSLYCARKLLTPESILYLYKATICPCKEYCCHIWIGESTTSLTLIHGPKESLT